LFGFTGLLMVISGANTVCFSLNMFLVNAGQTWDAARKCILFGLLDDDKGQSVGVDSEQYAALGIGEQIGGPLEDLVGPALNNFVKLLAVTAFVTVDMYDLTPERRWPLGLAFLAGSTVVVVGLKFGLQVAIDFLKAVNARLRAKREREEGTTMLRKMEVIARKVRRGDADDEVDVDI